MLHRRTLQAARALHCMTRRSWSTANCWLARRLSAAARGVLQSCHGHRLAHLGSPHYSAPAAATSAIVSHGALGQTIGQRLTRRPSAAAAHSLRAASAARPRFTPRLGLTSLARFRAVARSNPRAALLCSAGMHCASRRRFRFHARWPLKGYSGVLLNRAVAVTSVARDGPMQAAPSDLFVRHMDHACLASNEARAAPHSPLSCTPLMNRSVCAAGRMYTIRASCSPRWVSVRWCGASDRSHGPPCCPPYLALPLCNRCDRAHSVGRSHIRRNVAGALAAVRVSPGLWCTHSRLRPR
jgi:hypothetical protein